MFGELIVAYLFLGGAGAGCIMVASAIDLAVVREPFGTSRYLPEPAVSPLGRTASIAFLVGLVAVAAGIACLVADIGRADRILSLFASPHPTFLTFGSYALTVLLVLGASLAVVRFAYLPAVPRGAVAAAEVAAIVVAVAVMAYTGLLLATTGGVRLWATPLVPALFVLSSASSGIALVVLSGTAEAADVPMRATMRRLAAIDLALIAAEIACAAAFYAGAAGSDHPGVAASFGLLTAEPLAAVWWGGFVAAGLALPAVAEIAYLATSRTRSTGDIGGPARIAILAAAVLVLVGALSLRAATVGAGTHRDLELSPTVSSATAIMETEATATQATHETEVVA